MGRLTRWLLVLSTGVVILFSVGSIVLLGARASTGIPEVDKVSLNWKGLVVFPALIAHWALYHRARTEEERAGGAIVSGLAVIGLFALTYWKSFLWIRLKWGLPATGFGIWFAAMAARVLLAPPRGEEVVDEAPRTQAPARELPSAGPVRTAFRHPHRVEWSSHLVVLGVIGLSLWVVSRPFIGRWNPNDLSVILYGYLGALFLAYAAVSSLAFSYLRDNWNQAVLAYVLSVFAIAGLVALLAA